MIWALALALQVSDLVTYQMAVAKYPWGESGVLAMLGVVDLFWPKIIGIMLAGWVALLLGPKLRRRGLIIAAAFGLLGTATNLSALLF